MFILESKFGNDGYAFWFKLLELLATTDGHLYDCRNSSHWQFLLAKTQQDDISARSILNLLADLGAIDNELWEKEVIWCQNFVDNISDVYKNRKATAPTRPNLNSFYEKKPTSQVVSTDRNPTEDNIEVVSTGGNTQSKVKETKVNKTKVEEENTDVNVHRFYQENFGIETPFITEDIEYWINDLSKEVVILALQKAIEKNAEYAYAKGILKQWAKKGIKTLDAANAESLSKARKGNYSNNTKTETLPDWVDNQEEDEEVSPEEEASFQKRLKEIRAKKGMKT